jgi:amidase
MTGVDPRDAETKSSDGKAQPDYTKFLDPAGLKGARIGVVRGKELGLGPKVDPILEDAIRAMRNQGATVVDVVLPNMDKVGESEFEVLLYEFKADLETYLASRPGGVVRNLPELIAFNKANDTRELAWFGQEILEQAEKKGPLTDRAYLDALEKDRRLMRDEGIDKVMDDEKLDALVAIANGPAHVTDLVNGDAFTGGSSSPAAIAGYPSITVPAGYVSGLPVGVLFFGRAWSEPTLIKFAYSFEQATKARTAPQFKPTADVPASVYKNAAP